MDVCSGYEKKIIVLS